MWKRLPSTTEKESEGKASVQDLAFPTEEEELKLQPEEMMKRKYKLAINKPLKIGLPI